MAAEYLEPDMFGGLYLLAELHERRWREEETRVLVALGAEIRQQEVRFGLSPIDRRRLQWEVAKGEEAAVRRRQRRVLDEAARPDPRDLLRVVS